jgi:hypothetical protein
LGTLSSEINDLFLMRINDYRLNSLYQTSGSMALNMYTEAWLLDAITEFDGICNQDLTYTPSTYSDEGYFAQTLTTENKVMLSKLMVKSWLSNNVQELIQMRLFIDDKDMHSFSPSQNLTARTNLLNLKREEISQDLVEYGYKHNDWDNWNNQSFR